jgi:2-aminoadipate transaminase
LLSVGRSAIAGRGPEPLYRRLADALAARLEEGDGQELPSARALARELALNRATVTAAYRELSRRGLAVLRPGRPRRERGAQEPAGNGAFDEAPAGALDLARWAPDHALLPAGRVFRWLGLGESEGEDVAQYGSAWGYPPLRRWLAARLAGFGVRGAADDILLTAGVQHGLDLLLRALVRPGESVLVEDPTYPGLPPLLALHRVEAVGIPVGTGGMRVADLAAALRRRPRLAILTPTLHNPSGTVMAAAERRQVLALLARAGVQPVEEFFDPALVADGKVPPPLGALAPEVVMVGSFSKSLFPGLRVGWMTGPRQVLERLAAVKRAADLSGSTFLEAAACTLCQRGLYERQLERLRAASVARRGIVLAALTHAPAGVTWSEPRGAFSLLLELPRGMSARAVAARAGERGVWLLPGPALSVSGRDDVVRIAFAAAGGKRLEEGMKRVVAALQPVRGELPLV